MSDPQAAGPQLIAYADRMGGSIDALRGILEGPLAGVFDGVHLLPYFAPYDGADAGFDPEDHATVDQRLGTWEDVQRLALGHVVMSDLIVNHVSARSQRFRDVLARGGESPYAPMFLTLSAIYPDGASEEQLASIYRPRPGLPFTTMSWAGVKRLVWTTFTPEQVDIDLRSAEAWEYLESVIDALLGGGVTMLRLDAVGYTGKVANTNCFMTDASSLYTQRILDYAHARGAQVLLEVHGHYMQQVRTAATVDYVYDFALPPLVLHALHTGDVQPLDAWFAIRPANAITVLDTHDGIGIVDVGASPLVPDVPGLLAPQQIDALVKAIHASSHGTSVAATGTAASNLDLYQVNATFYDALGRDRDRYLLARLIQLMTPGIPQVYYVGLLCGQGDVDLLKRTGVGRDINRHVYSQAEIDEALASPQVADHVAAIRLRSVHPAFAGDFTYRFASGSGHMEWAKGEHRVWLDFEAGTATFTLRATDDAGTPVERARSGAAAQTLS